MSRFGIALGSNLEAHITALRELEHRQRCAGKNCTCSGPWVRNICQGCGGTDLGIWRYPVTAPGWPPGCVWACQTRSPCPDARCADRPMCER